MHSRRPWYREAIALVCLAGWLCACIDALGPPSDAVRLDPPARYRGWWKLTEACSALTADFDAVRWYVVPNASSFKSAGETLAGAYYPHGNQIVLADSSKYTGSVVRHEILHALMPNIGGHPRYEFLDRCGDIVACAGQCIGDAGGPLGWSATAPFIPASSLTIGILAPSPMSHYDDSGWTPITVAVTNNAPYAVRVAMPPILPSSYAGPAISEAFKYVTTPLAGGHVDSVANYTESTDLLFSPAYTAGSTRRVVFDYSPIPSLYRAPVGNYDVTGLFLGDASQPLVVSVAP